MKSFSKFIFEAISARQRARMLGLKSDGHGGWYSPTGEFEAKTVNNNPHFPLGLKFFNKNHTTLPGKDRNSTGRESSIASKTWVGNGIFEQQLPAEQLPAEQLPAEQLPAEQLPAEQLPAVNYLPVEKTKGILSIAFGRFNPPSISHQELLDTVAMSAEEMQGDYKIFPSRSMDKNKNPLDPDTKISFMRLMYPEHSERIVNDPNQETLYDVLTRTHNDGYSGVRIFSGKSKSKEIQKFADAQNGNLYEFELIEVIPVGETDPDGNKVEGMSSSRLRLAAAEGDIETFTSAMPETLSDEDILELFDAIRFGMGIVDETQDQIPAEEQEMAQESFNIWEIAPELDLNGLRQNYIEQNIYNIGEIIENVNTGIKGKIIRRGSNHLICVTENGQMFKSWIKDVTYNK